MKNNQKSKIAFFFVIFIYKKGEAFYGKKNRLNRSWKINI